MTLRSVARMALNAPRLLGLVAAVVAAELAVSAAVAVVLSPVLAVVFPPVVLVIGIAGLVPGVRAAREGDPPEGLTNSWTRPPLLPAVGVAVGGHAVALLLGTALFLVVDTPVRMALYWTGNGGMITAEVVLLVPAAGIAFGTVVLWGVVAPAVTRVVEGATARAALRRVLAAPVVTPRRALVGAAWGTGAALALSAASAPAVAHLLERLSGPSQGPAVAASSSPPALSPLVQALAASSVLWFLVGTVCLWLVLSAHLPGDAPDRPTAELPVLRVGLAVVLVLGAVGGVSAIRLTEIQPTSEREPLPNDPGEMYGTALENTERSDHYYRFDFWGDNVSERAGYEWWIDRSDRQIRQRTTGRFAGVNVYASTATTKISAYGANPLGGNSLVPFRAASDAAPPTYHFWINAYDESDGGSIWVPSATVDDWRVINRSEGRLVLAITDPGAVLDASNPDLPADRITDVDAARARAVIDTETATLRRYDADFNATVHSNEMDDGWWENGSRRWETHAKATFRVGVDVERPEELGPRSPDEWFWKLMAY